MKQSRALISTQYPCDYTISEAPNGAEGFLLLHGFTEAGAKIFKKCEEALPRNSIILAPNGLFPLPERQDSSYKIGFSWYFYDPFTDEYFIDMQPAIQLLTNLITKLGYDKIPWTVIGFSQGGYLAPFVAQKIPLVKKVIGIGCRFLDEELAMPLSFKMHGIHGEDDEIVKSIEAEASFKKLESRGVVGDFTVLKGVGHRISSEVLAKLKGLTN